MYALTKRNTEKSSNHRQTSTIGLGCLRHLGNQRTTFSGRHTLRDIRRYGIVCLTYMIGYLPTSILTVYNNYPQGRMNLHGYIHTAEADEKLGLPMAVTVVPHRGTPRCPCSVAPGGRG